MACFTHDEMVDWFTELEDKADTALAYAIKRIECAKSTQDDKFRKLIIEEAKEHITNAITLLAQAQFLRRNHTGQPN